MTTTATTTGATAMITVNTTVRHNVSSVTYVVDEVLSDAEVLAHTVLGGRARRIKLANLTVVEPAPSPRVTAHTGHDHPATRHARALCRRAAAHNGADVITTAA